MSDWLILSMVLAALAAIIYVARMFYALRMADIQRKSDSQRARARVEATSATAGIDVAALGGLDGIMDALGVPPLVRPAIASFIDGAGGVPALLAKLQGAAKGGGEKW